MTVCASVRRTARLRWSSRRGISRISRSRATALRHREDARGGRSRLPDFRGDVIAEERRYGALNLEPALGSSRRAGAQRRARRRRSPRNSCSVRGEQEGVGRVTSRASLEMMTEHDAGHAGECVPCSRSRGRHTYVVPATPRPFRRPPAASVAPARAPAPRPAGRRHHIRVTSRTRRPRSRCGRFRLDVQLVRCR